MEQLFIKYKRNLITYVINHEIVSLFVKRSHISPSLFLKETALPFYRPSMM